MNTSNNNRSFQYIPATQAREENGGTDSSLGENICKENSIYGQKVKADESAEHLIIIRNPPFHLNIK